MEITDKLNNLVYVLAFAKLVRQGCKLFQQDLKIFGRYTGSRLPGGPGPGPPGLSPASPIVNPSLPRLLERMLAIAISHTKTTSKQRNLGLGMMAS